MDAWYVALWVAATDGSSHTRPMCVHLFTSLVDRYHSLTLPGVRTSRLGCEEEDSIIVTVMVLGLGRSTCVPVFEERGRGRRERAVTSGGRIGTQNMSRLYVRPQQIRRAIDRTRARPAPGRSARSTVDRPTPQQRNWHVSLIHRQSDSGGVFCLGGGRFCSLVRFMLAMFCSRAQKHRTANLDVRHCIVIIFDSFGCGGCGDCQ